MARHNHTLMLVCLGLFAAALVLPARTGRAQSDEQFRLWPIVVETRSHTPAAAHSSVAPVQDAPFSLFMPIIRRPTEVTPVQFASAVSSEGALVNPQATFDYGITTVFASATVSGGQGKRYLVRWSFNGMLAPSLDQTGVIVSQTQLVTAGFCNSTGYGCAANLAPIGRITMLVQVFLDGVLVSDGIGVIQ